MKQRAWLSKAAFVAAVFVVVWIATIAYWKATYHPPSATELLTHGIAQRVEHAVVHERLLDRDVAQAGRAQIA
ncbi:hypothetical protein ACX84U_29705, partial [Burkholderia pseudomallei]